MPLNYASKLDAAILERARVELGEDEQRREQSVAIIREWLKKQPHLVNCPIDDLFIVNYLRGCKYSLEKTKKKVDNTMTMRAALPEFFKGWNPFRPELQAVLKTGTHLPLLDYDQLGRRVLIMRPGCYAPYLHKAEDIEKSNFMVMETMVAGDEQFFIAGLVIVIDFAGVTLDHLNERPFAITKKLMRFFEEAAPFRPQSINFIRTSSTFSTGYKLVSSIVNEKMKQRFKVHGAGFESLYREVSREILPKDYGGNGLSFAELTDYWKTKVENNAKVLAEAEKLVADEAKRPGKPKTSEELFGIEGSFRKLDID